MKDRKEALGGEWSNSQIAKQQNDGIVEKTYGRKGLLMARLITGLMTRLATH